MDSVEPYWTYVVCFGQQDTEGCLHRFDGLNQQEGQYLRIGVPADLLEPGDYVVTILGQRRGQSTRLDETYDVRIER